LLQVVEVDQTTLPLVEMVVALVERQELLIPPSMEILELVEHNLQPVAQAQLALVIPVTAEHRIKVPLAKVVPETSITAPVVAVGGLAEVVDITTQVVAVAPDMSHHH
jgi:hypothetical protein